MDEVTFHYILHHITLHTHGIGIAPCKLELEIGGKRKRPCHVQREEWCFGHKRVLFMTHIQYALITHSFIQAARFAVDGDSEVVAALVKMRDPKNGKVGAIYIGNIL